MGMTKTKILIGGAAVAAVAVVAFASLSRHGADKGVAVQTEPAALRSVVQTVSATGKVQPMTQVNISADVSAKITSLPVNEGDWVEKGALLVELDRERYVAAVESAEANLRSAQANANLARENMIKTEKDHERTSQLFAKHLESQSVLDTSHAAAEVEKARHQSMLDQAAQAEAALKQARDDLSKTSIYAPMAGTISKLNKEVGEIALGSQFQEDVIMEVSNLDGMEALVDVDENDIVLVSLGDEATIEVDALPDRVFEGRVTEIASSAKLSGQGTSDQKTEFEVKVAIVDAASELRPGMTASVDVVTEVRDNALSVPLQCVALRAPDQLRGDPVAGAADQAPEFTPNRDGFVEVVWVLDGDRARARQVRTGIQSESHIEIVDGLQEGEQVVTGSYRAISRDLKDGSLIKVGNAAQREG
jgi:HlyD family secretion protein